MTKLLPQISSLLQQKAAQCLSVDTGRIAGAGCGHSCGGSRRLANTRQQGIIRMAEPAIASAEMERPATRRLEIPRGIRQR